MAVHRRWRAGAISLENPFQVGPRQITQRVYLEITARSVEWIV